MILQTQIIWSNRIYSLKYQKSTTSGSKDSFQPEIIHVPGENNETADVLSRHHADIEKIQQEEGIQKPLSEDQACKILEKLKLKSGTRFTREEVATLLDVPSLPNPVPKKTRKSTAKTGTRIIKNTPKTLSNRKVKAPKTSMRRPGIVLLDIYQITIFQAH